MFSKSSDPTSAPPAPPRSGGSNASRSVLAADLKITGEILSKGSVEVLGEIEGNLSADVLVLGGEGRISGAVNANNVEVKGRLDGRVDCTTFKMFASAQVAADVTYADVIIENGASIEGRFSRVKV